MFIYSTRTHVCKYTHVYAHTNTQAHTIINDIYSYTYTFRYRNDYKSKHFFGLA